MPDGLVAAGHYLRSTLDGDAGKKTCTYGERRTPDGTVAAGFLPAKHAGW